MILTTIVATVFMLVAFAAVSEAAARRQEATKEAAAERAQWLEEDIEARPVGIEMVQSPAPVTTEPEPETEAEGTLIGSRDWGAEDAEILKRIAMAEAEGESTEGKALVMLVVLNRVWSDGFPDTIEEVVFDTGGGCYQFSPVAPGGRYWTTEPDDDCEAALELIESGWDESGGALYFEACAGDSWHSRNLEYLFTEGNHKFYR